MVNRAWAGRFEATSWPGRRPGRWRSRSPLRSGIGTTVTHLVDEAGAQKVADRRRAAVHTEHGAARMPCTARPVAVR